MKKLLLAASSLFLFGLSAQIETPAPSPAGKTMQTVGLTDLTIDYSRPHKRDRDIFGDLVPFDKMWRTGANKNTMITTSDILVFGKDTLSAGTYSIFATPSEKTWEIAFYTDTENWGTPDKWDDTKVALKTSTKVSTTSNVVESFTISIDDVQGDKAVISFAWDKVKAEFPFTVGTDAVVKASIEKVMSGPSASDLYKAGQYYLSTKENLSAALEYVNKALELRDDNPFWYLRTKALIQAELKDFKGAIATAKTSSEEATKANYESYVEMNQKSIDDWTKEIK
jgi:hypothetical protein